MSYQVIARKWRPKNFSELVGQSHISQTLQNALKKGRLHHALLFTGPRGTGKTSTARILAKSLRCPNAKDFIPCNTCQECEDIANGRGINVLEIDGASNNGVDAVRELRDSVGYMPSSGKYKLYIIDEVHMLSTSAFNALLKTLEEPPGHVIFILATTEVNKIPNTILSRCQRYDFRCVSTRQIAQHLAEICQSEGVTADNDALFAIARQGAGSLRDSQSLLDQVITFSGQTLTLTKVIEVLGLTDRSLLTEVLKSLIARDTTAVLTAVSKLAVTGNDAKNFIEELLKELRHTLFLKLNPQSGDIDLPDSEITALKGIGQKISAENLHLLFDMALKGAQDMMRAQDTQLVLEMILLRMACAPQVESFSMPSKALPSLQPAPVVVGTTTVPMDPAPLKLSGFNSQAPLAEQWHNLVAKINQVNPMVGAALENTVLQKVQEKTLHLMVSNKKTFIADKLKEESFAQKLTTYITTFWGPGFSYTIGSGEETPGQSPRAFANQQERDRQIELKKQVEAHPLVQTAIAVFKSQIRTIKEIT